MLTAASLAWRLLGNRRASAQQLEEPHGSSSGRGDLADLGL